MKAAKFSNKQRKISTNQKAFFKRRLPTSGSSCSLKEHNNNDQERQDWILEQDPPYYPKAFPLSADILKNLEESRDFDEVVDKAWKLVYGNDSE